jgi:hypothetical protein
MSLILRSTLRIAGDKHYPFSIETNCRVFDMRTLAAAVHALRAGCLGTYSRRKFFLVGSYLKDGEWVDFNLPFLIKVGKNWVVNPMIHMYLPLGDTGALPDTLLPIPNQDRKTKD